MNQFLTELLPTRLEQILLGAGGAVGALLGWMTGGISEAFYWLIAFAVADYVTGMAQAVITGSWASAVGFRGMMKKVIILSAAILAHGLATVAGMPAIETAVIFAFTVNEAGSILENLERAGYGAIIPPAIRAALKVAQAREEEMAAELGKGGKDYANKNENQQ